MSTLKIVGTILLTLGTLFAVALLIVFALYAINIWLW